MADKIWVVERKWNGKWIPVTEVPVYKVRETAREGKRWFLSKYPNYIVRIVKFSREISEEERISTSKKMVQMNLFRNPCVFCHSENLCQCSEYMKHYRQN